MDPADQKFRRVHPRSLIILLASSVVYYVILFMSFGTISPAFILIAGLGVVFTLVQILTRYVFLQYGVSSKEIVDPIRCIQPGSTQYPVRSDSECRSGAKCTGSNSEFNGRQDRNRRQRQSRGRA